MFAPSTSISPPGNPTRDRSVVDRVQRRRQRSLDPRAASLARSASTKKRCCLRVNPEKDVDGLHPTNLGRLVMGVPGPLPCTPNGIVELLAAYDVPVEGSTSSSSDGDSPSAVHSRC